MVYLKDELFGWCKKSQILFTFS
ncbi:uncharacterized protein G2W53_004302 [Senna tora]|uniref:Uncharacterized protein n=1 Tax=Senna tora TaxID=362788 RepID=A0A834WZ51_9FABA|nr:uncharacterized protein G2W53_041721 [Senna tora]KAF7832657.1 uncharacterized protein G2W53_014990 [Senna tora]KAF7835520.1 uncharacterized protein G2W53_010379 [Senna tora]KAF7842004.1 uncharacterized protein G2W53_004302 [Senna tora]